MYDYCECRTIRISVVRNPTCAAQSLEILENGLVKDLLNELLLNPTEYNFWLNDRDVLHPNDSFVSQGVKTSDKLFGTRVVLVIMCSAQK